MLDRRTYKGFNLMELIVVVIIIGVLATLAIPQFSTSRERSLGQEAQANLRLISAAQKIYRLEIGAYYPHAGTVTAAGTINSNLKLSLNENSWDYSIANTGPDSFNANADRLTTSGTYSDCNYQINQADTRTHTGNCPDNWDN